MFLKISARRAVCFLLVLALGLTASVAWGAPRNTPNPQSPETNVISLKSSSAVLLDAASGQVIFEKNAHERRHPASVTKVMTLVVAFEALQERLVSLNDEVQASPNATGLGGTQIYLEPGERMRLEETLKAVAIASANDAAVALAEHVAGTEEAFVEMMNQKARQLGMVNTHFVNPHGLDADDHYTTAYDLALLSRYAASIPDLVKLTSVYRDKLFGNRKQPFDLDNRNKLVRFYQGADGLKTGFTSKAGYTLAATALRGGTRMIATIMGAPTFEVRMAEARKLLDFGFATYQSVLVARKGEAFGNAVRIKGGLPDRLTAVLDKDFLATIRKGQEKGMITETELPLAVDAPVAEGQIIGYLVVKKDDREIGRAPLVAPFPASRAGYFRTLWNFFWDVLRPASEK